MCVFQHGLGQRKQNKGGFAVWNRALNPGLCDNLERWDGKGGARQAQEEGRVCPCGWLRLIVAEANTKLCRAALLQ